MPLIGETTKPRSDRKYSCEKGDFQRGCDCTHLCPDGVWSMMGSPYASGGRQWLRVRRPMGEKPGSMTPN